jgi:hypothetical protein
MESLKTVNFFEIRTELNQLINQEMIGEDSKVNFEINGVSFSFTRITPKRIEAADPLTFKIEVEGFSFSAEENYKMSSETTSKGVLEILGKIEQSTYLDHVFEY